MAALLANLFLLKKRNSDQNMNKKTQQKTMEETEIQALNLHSK